MHNTRVGTLTPYSMIVIGVILATLAALTVVQTQGISTSAPAAGITQQFEPKTGQLVLQAPPYCRGNCAGILIAIRALNRTINFLAQLQLRFSILVRPLGFVISILRGVQFRLMGRLR
ncbi:MAG: hypothetical protein WD627_01340 [Actinomycetota bacterium]